jgi:DnaJ-class molecular chaperone
MFFHVPNFQSLYTHLGVHLTVTCEEIRKAYKDLAMRMHPDRIPNSEHGDVTAAFQALHDAYKYCLSKVGTNYTKPKLKKQMTKKEKQRRLVR